MPDLSAALLALGDELADASRNGDSSNDLIQIVDDWFTEHGYPSFLYR